MVCRLTGCPGAGGVGKAFLAQLYALSAKKPQIKLVAVTRSKSAISTTPQEPSIPIDKWESLLEASTHPGLPPLNVLSVLRYHKSPDRSILVDNTSSEDVAKSYPAFLKAGVSVVTPNKKAFSGSLDLWNEIYSACSNPPPNFAHPANPTGGLIYHESTVGAGLPIISTLMELLATGDKIHRIEGVFSGTMSYLFNTFAPSPPQSNAPKWSGTVKSAAEQGFTEPDPRDDLNGADVARKLTILARICTTPSFKPVDGIQAFPVESLIPSALTTSPSAAEFLAKLPDYDSDMEKIKKDAAAQGKVIRFVGKIDVDKGEVKVGLEALEAAHPIAGLGGADNLVAFHTERYSPRPLVVQGAGAGGQVTAMGVMADLIRVLHRIGG